MPQGPPQNVLSQSLTEAIGVGRVRTAVFITYEFDPEFFELNILPLLFDRGLHPKSNNIRRAQLEEALREGERGNIPCVGI